MSVMDYRTRDGLADYGFSIEFDADTGWQVYIVFEPLYEGDRSGPNLPHQAIDHRGRRYIDWPSKVENLGEARTIAALWAELIHHYLHIQRGRGAMRK